MGSAARLFDAEELGELRMHLRGLWLTTALALATSGVAIGGVAAAQERYTPPGKTYHSAVKPAQRRAYFGELHLHTAMSFDAWTFGTKIMPDQAYKFARGETVMVPAIQIQVEQGGKPTGLVPARRAWPLDFTAVTDHSEYLGSALQLDKPDSRFSKTATGCTCTAT
jgi:hypothetical protein